METAIMNGNLNGTKKPQQLTPLERHIALKLIKIDDDKICDQPSCPICSEDYCAGGEVIQMQCLHFYHEHCLMPWLEMKRKCPICRFEVSDVTPPILELEKLTDMEIRQRIQWHEPSSHNVDLSGNRLKLFLFYIIAIIMKQLQYLPTSI